MCEWSGSVYFIIRTLLNIEDATRRGSCGCKHFEIERGRKYSRGTIFIISAFVYMKFQVKFIRAIAPASAFYLEGSGLTSDSKKLRWKGLNNALLEVVSFLWALKFPPTGHFDTSKFQPLAAPQYLATANVFPNPFLSPPFFNFGRMIMFRCREVVGWEMGLWYHYADSSHY